MTAEEENVVNIISEEYLDIFKELINVYGNSKSGYGSAIISDGLIPVCEGFRTIEDFLLDFSEQPDVNKEHVLGLLEKIKNESFVKVA